MRLKKKGLILLFAGGKKYLNKKDFICIVCAVLCGLLICVITSMSAFSENCRGISDSVLRLHILANSDSDADQELKLKVRDRILEKGDELFLSAGNLSDAEEIFAQNSDKINDIAKAVIEENGCDYEVNTELVNMYFNTRQYDNIALPSGYYDAVRISIGEAKGHNWWCVIYPSMCVSATKGSDVLRDALSDNEMDIVENYDKYEIKFKLLEFLGTLGFTF